MKNIRLFLVLIVLAVSLLAVSGCVTLGKKYVVRQQYALAVSKPKPIFKKKTKKILEIYYPQITPQFSGSEFVYRVSRINYTTDYYNTFFDSPVEQIHQNILSYLQAIKLFKYTTDQPYPLQADYVLKTYITELYADYRDSRAPYAVISIQFVLLDLDKTTTTPKILMNKTFHERIALKQRSSAALIEAWSEGLQKILVKLTNNLP